MSTVKLALVTPSPGLEVLGVLVGVAVARQVVLAAGDRDDGRAGHERVAQAGREVGRADVLAQRDAGLLRGARVAVGHVRGGLFAVGDDPLHADRVHLLERVAEDVGT